MKIFVGKGCPRNSDGQYREWSVLEGSKDQTVRLDEKSFSVYLKEVCL